MPRLITRLRRRATWPRLLFLSLILLLTASVCTVTYAPTPPPPQRLYLFDASHLHLNHAEHCRAITGQPDGRCDEQTPPPANTTHTELLHAYDTLILLTTLQGIVNKEQAQLYLLHDQQRGETPGVDTFWLEKYQQAGQPYGWLADTELITLPTVEAVLEQFAPQVEGLVVWEAAVPATLNVATTIAGAENLAVVRHNSPVTGQAMAHLPLKRSLVDMFQPHAATLPNSETPSSGSTKGDAYLWAIENYLLTGKSNPLMLAYLLDGWPAVRYLNQEMTRGGVYALERDYVVQQSGFAFDLSPWADELPLDDRTQPRGTDRQVLEAVVSAAGEQAGGQLIKLWGFIPWYEKYAGPPGGNDPQSMHHPTAGEWESTWLFSHHGIYLQGGGGDVYGVAMANVSAHKFAPPPLPRSAPEPPTEAELIAAGHLTPEGQLNMERSYVLFYSGDYDLVHPVYTLLANYATSPWQDARRGDVPLAWGFNPAMAEDIPGIMSYLYATQTPHDYFVGANTGAGYLNPDALSEAQLLRWLWRSQQYYSLYGYDILGFLLNGHGAHMSQARLDAFTFVTPRGMLSLNNQTDEPWPRLQRNTPLSALTVETLGGTPDAAALAVHQAYLRQRAEGRPPFLAIRSAFLSTTFLWGVRDRMQAHAAEGLVVDETGAVIDPNYTVVDPYTFFALMERHLREE